MVLFTGGCNFRCPFCHNRELVLGHHSMADIPFDYIEGRLRKFRRWIERVVITGGEPTIHTGLRGAIEAFRALGLKVKLDTNGSNPGVVKGLVADGLIDYVAMDVKGPLDAYDRWCGTAVDKARIRESIDFILEGRVDYEFRMTLVPFLHHEQDAFDVAGELKSARRFFLQDFVPRETVDPRFSSIQPFSPEKMKSIRRAVESIIENAPLSSHLH